MNKKELNIIREIGIANFPFDELHKSIISRPKYHKRWGYKNPKFYDDKAFRFEYGFDLNNVRYEGYVYIGIDIIDEFIIVITDKENNILYQYNHVYIFWVEDKIDYFFKNINNLKLKLYNQTFSLN